MSPTNLQAGGFEAVLADGTAAWIRPVRPDDKNRIVRGMQLLSPESRYLRFFTGAPELDPELLRYLTEVDQRDHVAWIAVNRAAPGEPGLGIARWVRLADAPKTAELAITVVDKFQGLGLGAALLRILVARAEEEGIETLRAIVLPDNHRFVRWFQRLGARTEFHDGAYQLDLPVRQLHPV